MIPFKSAHKCHRRPDADIDLDVNCAVCTNDVFQSMHQEGLESLLFIRLVVERLLQLKLKKSGRDSSWAITAPTGWLKKNDWGNDWFRVCADNTSVAVGNNSKTGLYPQVGCFSYFHFQLKLLRKKNWEEKK